MLKVIIKYPNGSQKTRKIDDEILGVSEKGDIVRSVYVKEEDIFDNVVIHSEDKDFYNPYVGEIIDDKILQKKYTPFNGVIEITLYNNK